MALFWQIIVLREDLILRSSRDCVLYRRVAPDGTIIKDTRRASRRAAEEHHAVNSRKALSSSIGINRAKREIWAGVGIQSSPQIEPLMKFTKCNTENKLRLMQIVRAISNDDGRFAVQHSSCSSEQHTLKTDLEKSSCRDTQNGQHSPETVQTITSRASFSNGS